MEESDKFRRQQIEDELGRNLSGGKSANSWLWWDWVDEKYRNWDSLIPEMLPEYYEVRGWTDAGVPSNQTMERLAL